MSEKQPFFSVLVTAFNSAEFIRVGLDSIRSQDFKDYELIIVCDKCVDNTAEVAREYTDLVYEIDHDIDGASVNKAMDMARGEWVLFMDDDDHYMPGAFGIIAEELKHLKDIDILAYGFEWKGMGIAKQSPQRLYPAVWNKAWRREFIGENRFPNWTHSTDLGFARMMHPKARFAYLNMPLYYYNFMRPGSVSDKIRKGEYDNSKLPENIRQAAEGYERWLKSKEF